MNVHKICAGQTYRDYMTCQLLDQVLEWFKLFPNLLFRCDLGFYPSKKCHKNSASTSTQSVGVYARANYTENRYPGRRDSHGWVVVDDNDAGDQPTHVDSHVVSQGLSPPAQPVQSATQPEPQPRVQSPSIESPPLLSTPQMAEFLALRARVAVLL